MRERRSQERPKRFNLIPSGKLRIRLIYDVCRLKAEDSFRLVATFTRRKLILYYTGKALYAQRRGSYGQRGRHRTAGEAVEGPATQTGEHNTAARSSHEKAIKQLEPNVGSLSKGDRVKIITKVKPPAGNRPLRRDTVGIILSITPKRVKVRTESGVITYRAPHNVSRIQE